MPKYRYVAKNNTGKTVTDEIDAFSRESLIQNLQGQGLFLASIEEVAAKDPRKPTLPNASSKSAKKFHHTKIKLNDIITFSRQLVTMLESGVTLLRSLNVIIDQIESKKLFEVVTDVAAGVEQGSSLSESMANHPKVFNQFWISLIEVGETAGTLPKVLNKLSFYLEQQAAFR